MAKQSKAQREYIRDIRTRNSINYSARTTKPRSLQNIDIILKTMKYNELDDDKDSSKAKLVKATNYGLLIFTVAFEMMVLTMSILAFALSGGKQRRKSRRKW